MKTFVKNCVFFLLLSLVFVEAGFSKSKKKDENVAVTAPLWTTEEGRSKLFPKAEYLTASAFGSSDSDAKSKAAAEISGTIKSQIESNVQSSYIANEETGVVSYRKELLQQIDVSTDSSVYQLEYTVPFYSPEYGMYVCVAYIKRANAFSVVKPKMDNAGLLFQKGYAAALQVTDDFEKVIALEGAKKCLKEFYEVYDFALAIYPEKAAEYSKLDLLGGECQGRINQIKNRIYFSFDSGESSTVMVYDKVHDIFTDNDFIVVKNGAYDYKVKVEVKQEINKTDDLYITYPFVSVEVTKGAKTYYSYSEKLQKCAGFDEETALRRADFELCKVLEAKLLKF